MRALDEMDLVPVDIPLTHDELPGELVVPAGARGLVLFAHGSGSGRTSTRNLAVAQSLHTRRVGTLLFDLLTPNEKSLDHVAGHLRFDVELLSERLLSATEWLMGRPELSRLRLGYFGASTGAAAALLAAAKAPARIAAIVSRGGRPDLASRALPGVRCPTLLVVGGHDLMVLELNRSAFLKLRAIKRLEVVPGATHLFEEPGAMERVGALATDWFEQYLTWR